MASGPTSARPRIPSRRGSWRISWGYAKADLLVPGAPFTDLATANSAAIAWCAEVNGAVHSETSAIPAERLAAERPLLGLLPSLRPALAPTATRTVDSLRTVRFGSARYSVPGAFIGRRVDLVVVGGELIVSTAGAEIARHRLVGPGEMSLDDAHYPGHARTPVRAIRPRTPAEIAFLGLGPVASAFLRAAAAAGTSKLGSELGLIADLERAHGRVALVAALERALAFRRFRAADVRSILAAGPGVPRHREPGAALTVALPAVPVRPLAAYALEPVA